MVYRLLGWGVLSEAYHKMQTHTGYRMFHVQVQKLQLIVIMELVCGLTNIPRFTEVDGIQSLGQLCPSKHPPQMIN